MSLVSIIVPLHNKEKYIKKCIESLLCQSYSSIEIIVVDDCSTDRSSATCELYKEKENFSYYKFEKNLGVSAARNFGIKKAKGDYIAFVDADDFLEKEYINSLMNFSKYDLIVSGYKKIWEDHISEKKLLEREYFNDFTKDIFNKRIFPYFSVAWGKLFKLDLIKQNKIFFPKLDFGEDTVFVISYLKKCKSLVTVKNCGYNNLIVLGSLSRIIDNNYGENLKIMLSIIENNFFERYSFEWTFLFLRNLKLFLLTQNTLENQKKVFQFFGNDIMMLKIKNIDNISDKLFFCLVRFKFFKIINLLVRLKKYL